MSRKIQVALVDDHLLFRQGLSSLLAEFSEIEIVCALSSGQELITFVTEQPTKYIGVVLLDLCMPEMDGFETQMQLKKINPEIKTIILTMDVQYEQVIRLIKIGVAGILLKDQEIDSVLYAVRCVNENDYYFNENISCQLVKDLLNNKEHSQEKNKELLTNREIQIVKLICQEFTNKEISEQLCLSIRTIEGHRERILQKTQAKNTVGIALYAVENKLYINEKK